jgi:hypothetical protein
MLFRQHWGTRGLWVVNAFFVLNLEPVNGYLYLNEQGKARKDFRGRQVGVNQDCWWLKITPLVYGCQLLS